MAGCSMRQDRQTEATLARPRSGVTFDVDGHVTKCMSRHSLYHRCKKRSNKNLKNLKNVKNVTENLKKLPSWCTSTPRLMPKKCPSRQL